MAMTTPAAATRTELAVLPVLSECCPPATAAMPDEAAATLASLFKALDDPARVKIMSLLLNAAYLAVMGAVGLRIAQRRLGRLLQP